MPFVTAKLHNILRFKNHLDICPRKQKTLARAAFYVILGAPKEKKRQNSQLFHTVILEHLII